MSVYVYDESKDKLLSVMDGRCGEYLGSSHKDSIFRFKMKDKTFEFYQKGFSKFAVKVHKNGGNHEVEFGYGSGSDRIDGGIAVKTDIGRYRPAGVILKDFCAKKAVRTHHSLTIRQLCEVAEEAVTEYQELLKMINGG